MTTDVSMRFGLLLKQFRLSAGLTQEEGLALARSMPYPYTEAPLLDMKGQLPVRR